MSTPQQNCIIYPRVSTSKQSQHNESLQAQIEACQRFAKQKNLNVIGIYPESYSGRKDNRPAYSQILNFIRQNEGLVGYLIVRVLDRLTRGGSDSYLQMKKELQSLGVTLIDTSGVIQPSHNEFEHLGFEYEWSTTSPSEIAEVVVATTDNLEVHRILKRTIEAEILLTQAGYKIRPPNDGFVNTRILVDGKKKTIQVRDPERAPYFETMFALRTSGQYSDQEIVDAVNEMGYLGKDKNQWNAEKTKIIGIKKGKPLTVKAMRKVIRRPIYAGVICEKWTHYKPIRAKYEGLVTIESFNQANRGKVVIDKDALTGELSIRYNQRAKKQTRSYNIINPEFPYKFIRCPHCGNRLKGSASRGKSGKRYPVYHCSRGHERFSIAQAEMHRIMEEFVYALDFSPSSWKYLERVILDAFRERQGSIIGQQQAIEEHVYSLKAKQKELALSLPSISSDIARKAIEEQIVEIEQQIQQNVVVRSEETVTEDDIRTAIRNAQEIVEHPQKTLLNKENPRKQEHYFSLVFETIPTLTEMQNRTPQLSFIYNMNRAVQGGQKQGFEPMAAPRGLKWNTIESWIMKWCKGISEKRCD